MNTSEFGKMNVDNFFVLLITSWVISDVRDDIFYWLLPEKEFIALERLN